MGEMGRKRTLADQVEGIVQLGVPKKGEDVNHRPTQGNSDMTAMAAGEDCKKRGYCKIWEIFYNPN